MEYTVRIDTNGKLRMPREITDVLDIRSYDSLLIQKNNNTFVIKKYNADNELKSIAKSLQELSRKKDIDIPLGNTLMMKINDYNDFLKISYYPEDEKSTSAIRICDGRCTIAIGKYAEKYGITQDDDLIIYINDNSINFKKVGMVDEIYIPDEHFFKEGDSRLSIFKEIDKELSLYKQTLRNGLMTARDKDLDNIINNKYDVEIDKKLVEEQAKEKEDKARTIEIICVIILVIVLLIILPFLLGWILGLAILGLIGWFIYGFINHIFKEGC